VSVRCSQTTAAGKPCKSFAVEGSDRCVSHLRFVERTVLTPQLVERITNALRGGLHLSVVLAHAGVPRSTFYGWLERGSPDGRKVKDALFRDLREKTERARAEGEVALGLTLAQAGRHDPQVAMWLLERQFPERWARVSQREMAEPGEQVVEPETDPFGEVLQLAEERRKRRSG
jgi:hypothetical protein